jgi:hypothetical protein
MQRLVKALAEELLAWRATLVRLRGTNDAEVDAVIDRVDAAIKTVGTLRAANNIEKAVS